MQRKRNRLSSEAYIEGVKKGDRLVLSRAITLIESRLAADQEQAREVMDAILPYTGKAIRLGVTGVPGVGKSTFIEAFGMHLVAQEKKKLAVLAIDPTSQRTRGSILGDKTRMEQLSTHPNAYIRPTAAGSSLGGVAAHTREAMLLCEAAGYDIVMIETVGVGQSETAVRNMVDCFLLLMLAGAGDELQGIKKGIMEMADLLAITKADGENRQAAERARNEYQNALHLFPLPESGWSAQVLSCSALAGEGLEEIWNGIMQYMRHIEENAYLHTQRQQQQLSWMRAAIESLLLDDFYRHPQVQEAYKRIEAEVKQEKQAPISAARQLFSLYQQQ